MRDSTIARAENRALLNRTYAICAITRENFDVIRSDLSSTAATIRPAFSASEFSAMLLHDFLIWQEVAERGR